MTGSTITQLLHIRGAAIFAMVELDDDFSGCTRLRGGAGRTRTNHQSVMEHGWCPTNSPGRTPLQIAGRFAVLLDFPGFLILESTPECYGTWFESDQLPWSDTHPDRRAFVVFRDYPGSWSDSNEQPDS